MPEINSPFTMVVIIVLIGVSAGVVNTWLKARENSTSDRETQDRVHRLEAEVSRLTERVRTLEKITTDPDRKLREDISRLA